MTNEQLTAPDDEGMPDAATDQTAESPPFTVGDVVRLKSGGTAMTVLAVSADGHCVCAWFQSARDEFSFGSGQALSRDRSPVAALEKPERP